MTVLNPLLKRLDVLIVALTIPYGCGLTKALHREEIQGLGRFEYREPAEWLKGVVISAPHGRTDRHSDKIARSISDRTGAGLAIAYGFKSKRLGVSQPVVRSGPYPASWRSSQRGSVFKEYRKVLRKAAKGETGLYIGVHRSSDKETADRIEVATSGLTFEEARALKDAYVDIRDRLAGEDVAKLALAIEPLDTISWRAAGVKHHGVLLVAEKGLNLRLPQFSSYIAEDLYTEILSLWVDRAIRVLAENPLGLPQIQVKLMELGKFELIKSRKGLAGVVIGAPHGSYDEYTAEMVKRVSYRTGLAAVIAKGFTPTEAGGWRINVNRPSEKTAYSDFELRSQRSREVYRAFRELVFKACAGELNLYIDVHQYNTNGKIQVATVGISRNQAMMIKRLYQEILDRVTGQKTDVPMVDLWIEPLDEVEIGAWAAKAEGILGLARRSLHFELPSHKTFVTAEAREAYIGILSSLFSETVPLLLYGDRGQGGVHKEEKGQ